MSYQDTRWGGGHIPLQRSSRCILPPEPTRQKNNLIKTLMHRALVIYSESKLDDEIKLISMTHCYKGFPLNFPKTVIKNKIVDLNKISLASVQRALYICVSLGWVDLVIDLLSRSRKQYRNVIFQPMYGLSLTRNLYWHQSVKMFFSLIIIIYLYIYLNSVAVWDT